jgi:hypothetical protein
LARSSSFPPTRAPDMKLWGVVGSLMIGDEPIDCYRLPQLFALCVGCRL